MVAIAILALALMVRLALLFVHPKPLESDELDYDQLGWTLAQTGHYSMHGAPTAFRVPGYPIFIAGVYALAGRSPIAVKVVQDVLDSLTALLLYLLLRRRDARVATVAGITWALFPAAILFTDHLLSETLFTFGVVLFALLVERDRVWMDWVAGIVLGALVITKPSALLFAAAIPIALLRRPSGRSTAAILTIAVLPLSLWILRNVVVMGTPAVTTSIGTNLLVGNNRHATGGYMTVSPEDGASSAADEREADRAAGRAAIRTIRERPLRAIAIASRSLAYLVTSEAELTAGAFRAAGPDLRLRDRYQAVPLWIRALVSVPSAVILFLGVFGLAAGGIGIEGRLFWSLFGSIAFWSFVFFGSSRFRFPVMPLLVAVAVRFALNAKALLGGMQRRRLLVAATACVVIAAVWIAEGLVLAGSIAS